MNKEQKPRSIRLSDKTWNEFKKIKKRGESWEVKLNRIMELIEELSKN